MRTSITGYHPVSWVHLGVRLGQKSNIYKSVRTYHDSSLQNKICLTYGTLDVSKYLDKEVKFVVTLKAQGKVKENAYLFLASRSKEQLDQIPDTSLNTSNINALLANVVIGWNVFQHFYHYFDVVKVDWETALSQTLGDVYKGKSETDYYKSLCRMVAKLEDGHGVVSNDKIVKWGLPVTLEWIENKAVVTATNSFLFLRGDIIEKIDDKSAADELQE